MTTFDPFVIDYDAVYTARGSASTGMAGLILGLGACVYDAMRSGGDVLIRDSRSVERIVVPGLNTMLFACVDR